MAKRSKKKKAVAGKASTRAAAADPRVESDHRHPQAKEDTPQKHLPRFHREGFLGWALVLAIILSYTPVCRAGFIWDDDYHVTTNPYVVGPFGPVEIWTTPVIKFCPLVYTTFWLEYAVWEAAPLPYHLVNVLVHAASAILLWRVLRSLRLPGAWLGAALWALHPVQVESVAWISELKNTESAFFFLLSILFFQRWLAPRLSESGGRVNGGLTLLFAALAMLAKSSTVILPVVLGLLASWVDGGWRWRNLKVIVPVFFMSVIASGLTIWNPAPEDPGNLHVVQTWPERLVTAGDAIWFYLGKLIWPYPLVAVYPHWNIDAASWHSYLPLLAVVIVTLFLARQRRSWSRACFLCWSYFLVALLPALGLVDMPFLRYSFVADHFQYLASMGPLALLAAGLTWSAEFVFPGRAFRQACLGAALLIILGTLSWRQAWSYESRETLWTQTVRHNPEAWVAYGELGHIRLNAGRFSEAIQQIDRDLRINPLDGNAYAIRGNAEEAIEDWPGALRDYYQFVRLSPHDPNANYAHLWIWCLRVRQHERIEADRELAAALSSRAWNPDPKGWDAKNADYLLGRLSETDYFTAANSPDAETDCGQHCGAWYYAGMKHLLAGDQLTAIDYFRKCVATGEADFVESLLAQAELNNLNAR